MRKVMFVVLVVLALTSVVGVASATPNGGVVPFSVKTGR